MNQAEEFRRDLERQVRAEARYGWDKARKRWEKPLPERVAANEALALRDGGLQPGKLLVLHANSSLEAPLRAALERKLGPGQVHDAKSGPVPPETFCTVTTLNAATGLEAPVVILLGTDHLLESEQDTRLSEEERGDLRRDHTRMLYMGFTRAGQRLLVLRRGG